MSFVSRHLGNNSHKVKIMLNNINKDVKSLDELITKIVPKNIRSDYDLNNNKSLSEKEVLTSLKSSFYNSYDDYKDIKPSYKFMIGKEFNDTELPNVIVRNLLENPKWYTSYTPYQPEISQGRLESLFNFQTMICEITDLPVSNCSLLDSGTAGAEAFNLATNFHKGKRRNFFCDHRVNPVIKDIIRTRAKMLNINFIEDDIFNYDFKKSFENEIYYSGALFAYPDFEGFVNIKNIENKISEIKETNTLVITHNDIMSLLFLKSPGALGSDISFGTTQRFGLPLWNGGPHSAFFATQNKYLRLVPGRIVGESKCRNEKKAFRLALQTREQHIKKEKASSNICTSQALLANTSAMYAIYHGKNELINKALDIFVKRNSLEYFLDNFAINIEVYKNPEKKIFNYDKIYFNATNSLSNKLILSTLRDNGFIGDLVTINDKEYISLAISENIEEDDLIKIYLLVNILTTNANHIDIKKGIPKYIAYEKEQLNDVLNDNVVLLKYKDPSFSRDYNLLKHIDSNIKIKQDFFRKSNDRNITTDKPFLSNNIFKNTKSETWMLRYINSLADKDYSLVTGMIPLGSCTMKLNATSQMMPISWTEVQNKHPYSLNKSDFEGYNKFIRRLSDRLLEITQLDAINYQSNSGAMGELSGLAVMKSYHREYSDGDRNTVLIPISAHGTNFSSAALAGLKIEKFDETMSNEEFNELCNSMKSNLAGLMVTYPSTFGIFNENIKFICDTIHKYGGLVYMDGANLNAQCGITSPGDCGADICHLNLHKTFCIPHGGGGPGMGPICVKNKLVKFLPDNSIKRSEYCGDESNSYGTLTLSANSSASILTIPYIYLETMGNDGILEATKHAILNANYLKKSLEPYYTMFSITETKEDVIDNKNDKFQYVGHEFIIKVEEFGEYGITDKDIAKRLIDYNFHPPTMSWPVPKSLMIEPTESEDKEELDRFIEAMIKIREEIQEVIDGIYEKDNNVLVNSPHSLDDLENWKFPYSISKALYPVENLKENKHYPVRSRIDDIYGDRNLKLRLSE